uniref:Nucleoporin Nup54 alpha-helical domain-containing protein n=1 Tax=Corethron hystrix TaxID=216773 RepID=A0A6U5K8B5_9STRA
MPSFNFGSTPAAAGPTPAAGGFNFGANTPASSFGAPAPAGGLFSSSTPASAPAGGGLFGTSKPAFGNTPAAAPAFGNTPAAAFGNTPAAVPSGENLFNLPAHVPLLTSEQAAAHTAALAAQQSHFQSSLRLQERLRSLRDAYAPTEAGPGGTSVPSSRCRFRQIFYDPVDPARRHLYGRPAGLTEEQWEDAQRRSPDNVRTVPALVVGAEALQRRIVGQRESAVRITKQCESLGSALDDLKAKISRCDAKLAGLARKQGEIRRRSLQNVGLIEVVRCRDVPRQGGEAQAEARTGEIVARLEGLVEQVETMNLGVSEVKRFVSLLSFWLKYFFSLNF